ncbi:hypothetical protein BHM03_00033379 [Ensete ventricosum]|nr:hypothetical protein BHM03_00033379 [Ensete ventricosum]
MISAILCLASSTKHKILYLLFLFQIPVAPLQGQEEMHSPSDSRMRNSITYEDVLDDQGIPTMITWTHGGKEVFVEGSWDNWKTKYWRLDLVCQNLFSLIVCGGSRRLCFVCVIAGNPCKVWLVFSSIFRLTSKMVTHELEHVVVVQAFVAEDLRGVAGLEMPRSPESSYNNWPLGSEDYSKEPPLVPPQLHLTLLNSPPATDRTSPLTKPPHVALNHLYIQKEETVVALGKTHRFDSKYVTVILYRSLAE